MWRQFHDLGPDCRPLGRPDEEPVYPPDPARYRRLLYGFAKAAAVIEEGAEDDEKRPVRRPAREQRSAGGVVLPTGVDGPTP